MTKEIIQTTKAPEAIGPYSQAVRFDNVMYISGQLPIDVNTKDIPQDIQTQTINCMKNIGGILDDQGLDYQDIVKCTIYVTDMEQYGKVNEEYAKFFPEDPPARAVVGVKALPKNANVEIEAIVKLS